MKPDRWIVVSVSATVFLILTVYHVTTGRPYDQNALWVIGGAFGAVLGSELTKRFLPRDREDASGKDKDGKSGK